MIINFFFPSEFLVVNRRITFSRVNGHSQKTRIFPCVLDSFPMDKFSFIQIAAFSFSLPLAIAIDL